MARGIWSRAEHRPRRDERDVVHTWTQRRVGRCPSQEPEPSGTEPWARGGGSVTAPQVSQSPSGSCGGFAPGTGRADFVSGAVSRSQVHCSLRDSRPLPVKWDRNPPPGGEGQPGHSLAHGRRSTADFTHVPIPGCAWTGASVDTFIMTSCGKTQQQRK